MKEIIKSTVSFLVVAGLILVGLAYFSFLTERKDSREKFAGFYEEEEKIEVLFLGSSHVLNGIFPMELWHDYGIVSYNMAGHGNRMAMNYWTLKNALDYQKPSLVVFDACMLDTDEKIGNLEQLHILTDHIPYSQTKVEMIEDLVEEEDRRRDFLWKFSTYHHRWNELEKRDFVETNTPEKGAESRIDVAVPVETILVEEYDTWEEEGLGVEYARKMIEECQENEIDVLVTYLPFPDQTGWQKESLHMEEIAKEYGVDFLDYHTLLEQVNLNTDFYDKDSHMNPSGARKVTKYIGKYIVENYSVEDKRNVEAYSSWHEDYDRYRQFKKENIQKETELKNYLMLLNDSSFSYGIYLKPWGQISSYPVLLELLKNLGFDEGNIPGEDCFVFVNKEDDQRQELKLFETLENEFGEFSLFYNDDGHLEFTNSEASSMILTYSDIAIVVFDSRDFSFVDQADFVLKDMPMEFLKNKKMVKEKSGGIK